MIHRFWAWSDDNTLTINGTIAEDSWFEDDVTPAIFRSELESKTGDITLWINSPGGDVFAASEIYSMLLDYKGNVTVKISALAASAASVVAVAGSKVLMAPTAMMMIHNPLTLAYGDKEEMKKAINTLDEVKESIINAYVLKTNLPRSTISKLMDNETWMSAEKAVELGFADGMLGRDSTLDTDTDTTHNTHTGAKTSEGVSNNYLWSEKRAEKILLNRLRPSTTTTLGAPGTTHGETQSSVGATRQGRSIDRLLKELNSLNSLKEKL